METFFVSICSKIIIIYICKNGTNKEQIKTIAIAGATGFIGSRLCSLLSSEFRVVALSRGNKVDSEQITWRQCDLYSLESCTSALTDVDAAVYLVHSMMPSARLTQAKFEDLDLILERILLNQK